MYTVNPELLRMMGRRLEKSAVVPSDAVMMAGGPPPGGAPPMDPAAMGAAQPVDPAMAAMGMAPPPGADPTGAATMAAPPVPAPPAPMPPATPTDTGAPAAPKIKPEQMMQMLDFRLYNMQQQLTAIMNAMGVQVDPAALVLPPGTTAAPPAEAALPGGPMAPPPQDPSAAAAPQGPGGPMPPGAPMDPSQPPMDPAGKQASWWEKAVKAGETYNVHQPNETQSLAEAVKIMLRNL